MSGPNLVTAELALRRVADHQNDPIGEAYPFVCPYPNCQAFAQHKWGVVKQLTYWPVRAASDYRVIGSDQKIVLALCTSCNQEVVFIDGKMVEPSVSQAPAPSVDLPVELAEDFEEARKILPISPRGSAALLRLVVQKLLPIIGAQKDDINKMIGELVSRGTISTSIQQALDSVRVIGNEAVHPGTMDLKDDHQTATSLFRLINFIVEKAITEPKEISAIFSGLPVQKLAGIASRDKAKP